MLLGTRVQGYKYVLVRTELVQIDAKNSKESKLFELYELTPTTDRPFYWKYYHMHWKENFTHGISRMISKNQLTRIVDRV